MNLNDAHKWADKDGNVLILRGVGEDRTSHGGFKWPAVGESVTATDWTPTASCGGGLHGWPWSFGVGEGRDICDIVHWQVCTAKPDDVVGNLEGGCKCKFRTGTLIYEGGMAGAFSLVRAGFEDFVRACAKVDTSENASSGVSARLASSGVSAQLASSGVYARLASSGDYARLASSGDYAQLASSGASAQLASSGVYAQLASSGVYARLASSGVSAQLASSGVSAQLASSGVSARLASSGVSARLASSGASAQLASSGDYAQLASSGDYAQLASSGVYARLAAKGKDAIAMATTDSSRITVGEFGCFALGWRDKDGHPRIAVGRVGVNGIKAGVCYTVNDKGRIIRAS
jgi:hypothetical protein